MNTKKLAIYIITPVLGIAAVTAVTLPNVISPISPTGAAQMERTLVLDSSTNEMFQRKKGPSSAPSNTPTGDSINFTAHYVTPTGDAYEGSITGYEADNKYSIHGRGDSYWCFITHDKPFNEIRSVAVNYSAEFTDRIDSFALYASSVPFTSYPTEGQKVQRVNYHSANYDIKVNGSDDHYFALAYDGYNSGSYADDDYYIALMSITIKYYC